MAALISDNWQNTVDPDIRKAFFDSFDEIIKREAMVPRLFDMRTSKQATEYDLSISGMGDFEEFDGNISYDDVYEGYKSTFTHVEYTKGLKIQRKLRDDDQHNIIGRLPSQRGVAAARSREKSGAAVFNGSFSGTSGPDSLSLCNAAHTSTVAGVATQSNRGTDTLSKTSVSTARLNMKKFKQLNGELVEAEPDTLIAPLDKEEEAWIVISSKGEPETDTNNLNFHYGKYKLAVWNKLTSTTNWWLADSRLMKECLVWYDRVMLELNQDTAFNTYEGRWSAYMRYITGWSHWIWIYGNQASS